MLQILWRKKRNTLSIRGICSYNADDWDYAGGLWQAGEQRGDDDWREEAQFNEHAQNKGGQSKNWAKEETTGMNKDNFFFVKPKSNF